MLPKMTAVLAVLALWPPAPAEKGALKEYNSRDGMFKVLMYASPKQQKQAAAGITVNMVLNDLGSKVLAVAYNDFPLKGDESAEQIQKGLDGARDGAIRNMKGKLLKESKITLAGKYPGREFTAEIPDGKGIMKARIYIVGKRMYQLLAGGEAKFAGSADVNKFFDSFELTK